MIKDRLTYGRKAPLQASKRERKRGRDLNCEVGAFYWTALAPDIVNPGREEQGSVSA